MTIVKAQYRVTQGEASIDSSIEVHVDLSRFKPEATLMDVVESCVDVLREKVKLAEPLKVVCQNGVPTS